MRFQSEEEDETPKNANINKANPLPSDSSEREERENFLDPPRELPKRSYSLEPDMANGWKPKRSSKFNPNSVFSLNYDQYAVD